MLTHAVRSVSIDEYEGITHLKSSNQKTKNWWFLHTSESISLAVHKEVIPLDIAADVCDRIREFAEICLANMFLMSELCGENSCPPIMI